jgi:hypothetical protein
VAINLEGITGKNFASKMQTRSAAVEARISAGTHAASSTALRR